MNISRPYAAVSPALDGDVLAILAGTNRPLTGREVARLAGRRSHAGVRQVLSRLTEQGVVDRQEAGRAFLFTLNRDHLAAPAVAILADMRPELFRRLRRLIESWHIPPVHASVFGSVARGGGDARSDVDIFVVRPDRVDDEDAIWRQQLAVLAGNVERWTGNRAAITEVAEADIPQLRREEPPILGRLREQAVPLYGPDARVLMTPAP